MNNKYFSSRKLAQGIGWYSIALAVVELISPKTVNQTIGIKDDPLHHNLVRVRGVRELISGIGIVASRKPAGYLWSRVAGDVIDFALVGQALTHRRNNKQKLLIATAAFSAVALLDVVAALSQTHKKDTPNLRLKRSIKVNGTPDELYELWRQPETLPKIMKHFAEFTHIDAQRSHWKIPAAVGPALEWEAVIVEEREGKYLRWESLPGTTLPTRGWVNFRSLGKGDKTEVCLCLDFEPPAGALGEAALKLVQGIPNGLVQDMLNQFKTLSQTHKNISLTGNHNPSTVKVGTRPGDGAGAF